LGLSFSDVAGTLNTATNGTLSSYYQEGGFQYPIYVQVEENKRKTSDALLNLPLSPRPNAASTGAAVGANGNGGTAAGSGTNNYILMNQVARIKRDTGPNEVTRQSSQRYIAITAVTQGRPQSEVQADVQRLLEGYKFPPGYYWDLGIAQKRQGQEFAGLGLAVALAIALIYMLLASQFESFIHPLTILVSVPLSAFGVVLALFLTGRAFGLTAFIGLLLLIGIVVKNGILLIDYTNQLRRRGLPRDEAVLTASPTRLRPILMTTGAAILGMLPLALGLGKGMETQTPLATSVIGGLTTSTLLTLFIVPVVYTLFDDMGRWFQKDKRDLAPAMGVEPSIASVEATRETAGVGRE
jgi:hydrophobic/amphiphilic exporter-1 (mainly G- bacteria), HAE1 family